MLTGDRVLTRPVPAAFSELCGEVITREVTKLMGIKKVVLDMANTTARVTYDPRLVSGAAIRKYIDRANDLIESDLQKPEARMVL